jgi:hypothetical protein
MMAALLVAPPLTAGPGRAESAGGGGVVEDLSDALEDLGGAREAEISGA